MGCQLGHVMKTFQRRENNPLPTLLIFDIFANAGGGADQAVGPTRVVRRQVVRAFKAYFKKITVVEAVIRRMSASEVVSDLDPLKIYESDPETFIAWLEISLASGVSKFINAGGHFADTIVAFRNSSEVIAAHAPEFCTSSGLNLLPGGKPSDQGDDLANDLFGNSH